MDGYWKNGSINDNNDCDDDDNVVWLNDEFVVPGKIEWRKLYTSKTRAQVVELRFKTTITTTAIEN